MAKIIAVAGKGGELTERYPQITEMAKKLMEG